MNRKWMPLLGWSVLFCLAGPAWGDGVVLNGVSPRSIGRGGTNIAHADNGAVLFDNPAGAVNIQGSGMVDVGFDLMLSDFRFANARNNSAADDSVFPLAQVSLIRKSGDGQWAYGVGLFVPAGFGEAFDLEGPPPLAGQYHYKSFGTLAKILPGAAYRVTDRLSLGATLGVAVTHDELEGPYFLQGPGPLRGTPTIFDLQATGAAPCWSLGLQYDLSCTTTVGLTYQSESRFRADGTTRATVPGLGQSRFDTTLDVTWPASLGLGVKHEICSHRSLSADVIWFNWSQAFDDFGIHLNNPTNPFFPPIYEQFPLGWRDTVSVRLGYEQLLSRDRVLRFGYVHHRNPIPDSTLTPFIQATHENAFSAGYGWMWKCWNVDLAYMFAFGGERSVGTSDFVGRDLDRSFHRAQTHAVCFSFLRRF
jgi:long-subunit fatty acid transport protein